MDGSLSDVMSEIDDFKEQLDDSKGFEFVPNRSLLLRNAIDGSGKILSCINANSEYQINSRGASIDFKEACFVSVISILSNKDGLRLTVKKLDGTTRNIKGNYKDGCMRYGVDLFIAGIHFEYEGGLLSKTATIGKIEVYSWSIKELEVIEGALQKSKSLDSDLTRKWESVCLAIDSERERLRSDVQAHNDLLAKLSAEADGLGNKISELDLAAEKAENNFVFVSGKLKSLESERDALEVRIDELKKKDSYFDGEVERKNADLRILIGQISEKDSELKSLNRSVNLFPDDLKGFAERAEKNRNEYMWMSAIPWVIFVIFSWMFVSSAHNLVSQDSVGSIDSVLPFLLQRLPYVLIVTAFVGGAFAFLTHLFRRIEEVHQQELNLSKISIVARDIAVSEFGDEEDEGFQQKKLDLKIKMIQGYLASEFIRSEKALNKGSEKYESLGGGIIFSLLNGMGRSKGPE